MFRLIAFFILVALPAYADCASSLMSQGYAVKRLSAFSDGVCGIDDPVLLSATPSTNFSSPITLSCKFAKKVGAWTAAIGADHITHVGGYNCRKIAGSFFMSQHSYGNAIDVVAIDGVPISKQWRSAYKEACKIFTTVRTPDHDAAHHDHLHIDSGWGFGCIVDFVR